MSYTYLKDRKHYEETYDRFTVDTARRHIGYYYKFYAELERKLPKGDKMDRPGNAIILNVFYMQTVGDELLDSYEKREERINDWVAKDQEKDDQISSARLSEEPICKHCRKLGLRIIDKSLMNRSERYDPDEPEEVLFMLKCPHCKKNSAYWEDGEAWVSKPTLCPKCKTEMTHKSVSTKKSITSTYACPSCKYSKKDKIDIADKKDIPDPDYETDRIHYCLEDKEFRDRLFEIRRGFEGMAALGKEFKEKEDNKHIYDAMKELKKLKITDLSTLLITKLEKSGYIEFSLDKPEMGRDVVIGFNCLDSKTDRDDYDSRKTLKKLVDKALIDTNWRLTSDGVSYRLGYLSGRLKAYEREEDIKNLVMKTKKLKPKRKTKEELEEEKLNETSMDDGKIRF